MLPIIDWVDYLTEKKLALLGRKACFIIIIIKYICKAHFRDAANALSKVTPFSLRSVLWVPQSSCFEGAN